MVVKMDQNPVERMLASLLEGPEIENYGTHEIEAMPIEQVRKRLDSLGVDSVVPGYIRILTNSYVAPAQKVLEALDNDFDKLSPEEIEHLQPEEVKAKLNDIGLNYLLGINRIRELTGSGFDDQQNQIRLTVTDSPSHEQKRQLLQRHFLLRKLTDKETLRLAVDWLVSNAPVECYPAGYEIFAKGSPGQSLMAVLRGSVKLSSLSEDGKEVVLNIFSAGQIFGEMAVLDGQARSANAIAMTDCELLVVNRRELLPILENRPDLCMILLKMLGHRVREKTGEHRFHTSAAMAPPGPDRRQQRPDHDPRPRSAQAPDRRFDPAQ